jgi:hypothetical protein
VDKAFLYGTARDKKVENGEQVDWLMYNVEGNKNPFVIPEFPDFDCRITFHLECYSPFPLPDMIRHR